MFDIDGVLLRGKTPIPFASEALKSLMDKTQQEFNVPCVFCTNGFGLRKVKAATLSEKLGVHVSLSLKLYKLAWNQLVCLSLHRTKTSSYGFTLF